MPERFHKHQPEVNGEGKIVTAEQDAVVWHGDHEGEPEPAQLMEQTFTPGPAESPERFMTPKIVDSFVTAEPAEPLEKAESVVKAEPEESLERLTDYICQNLQGDRSNSHRQRGILRQWQQRRMGVARKLRSMVRQVEGPRV